MPLEKSVKPGPLADAMHEMNETMGLSDPRTVLCQNLGPTEVDHVPPEGYGVFKPGDLRGNKRYLKRVTVKPVESKAKEAN